MCVCVCHTGSMASGTIWSHGVIKSLEDEDGRYSQKHKDFRHRSYEWNEEFGDRWDKRNRKAGPAYPHFKHSDTKESLCIDGFPNPARAGGGELRHRGLAQQELSEHSEKVVRAKQHPCNDKGSAFVALLRACAKNKDLYRGTRVHDDILKWGLLENCTDALVTMYAKCGALAKAQELLDMHECTNIFSWNALIAGYARQGHGRDALKCFDQMRHEGLSPNAVTFACILKACGSVKAIDSGEQIHEEIARQGLLKNDIVLGNALVDMYAKCGALTKAQSVLQELPSRDVVSWNALITGYAQQGQGKQALNCFEQMQREGISPDAVTFICILKACGSLKAVDEGEQIHDEIARQGLLGNDIVLGTALVDMYAKCGALTKAQQVLNKLSSRNVVSWNALITGYALQGQGQQALDCYERMQHEGIFPDAVTFACVLKACGSIGAANKGEQIHDRIAKQGLLEGNIVLGTALVDMYAKCGSLEKAQHVLNKLPFRDVVSWNSLIAGYAQEGQGEQALNCFEQMQREGLSPNTVTFTCILKACGSIGAADKGEQVHDEISRQDLLQNDIALGSALVDMYAKCGALAKAQRALEELPSQDLFSWNALVAGYAHQGQCEQALNCLEQMRHKGLSPNAVTFSCVLNVCSHLGLIEDGNMYFTIMSTKYGIKPDLEHYTCMVDLFGRAGHLDKAIKVIQEMPSSDYSAVWSALLGACRKWGDVNVGRWAFEQAVRVDKSDAAAYVLMADIYAAAGLHQFAENIKAIRVDSTARLQLLY